MRTMIFGVMAVLAAAAGARAEETKGLTAEQVLDKGVEAVGGREAWDRIKAMEMWMAAKSGGFKAQMDWTWKAPDRIHVSIDMSGYMQAEGGYDGKAGWSKDPMQGLVELPAERLDKFRHQRRVGALHDWKARFARCELQGKEKVGDAEAYKVVLTSKDGLTVQRWYDAGTFLLLKEKGKGTNPFAEDDQESVLLFKDYREHDGVKVPMRFQDERGQVIEITHVKLNPPVDDSKFQKPGLGAPGK